MGPSRRPRLAAFILLGIPFVAVLLLFIFVGGRMDGDGQNYYIYLRSLVFDGDLDLRNDYEMFPRDDPALARICIDSKTNAPNVFSIGPAVIWSPFFLVARLISVMMPPDYEGNTNLGRGEPYYTAVCLASVLMSFIGIVATYRFVARKWGRGPALLGTLAIWLAGSTMHYQIFEPFMSHALSVFAVSLFVAKAAGVESYRRRSEWVTLGAFGGLMTLVRWQNLLFALLPMLLLILQRFLPRPYTERKPLPMRNLALSAVAWFVAFFPQMIVWRILYGEFLLIPQTPGFIDPKHPHLLEVLFSTRNGLMLFTPVILLAVVGLLRASIKRDRFAVAMLVVFVLQLYLNASVLDWWAGHSFGARRFVGLFPIFVYGFAALIFPEKRRGRLPPPRASAAPFSALSALVVLLILWNAMLNTRYVMGQIPRDRAVSLSDLLSGQFDMAGEWAHSMARLPDVLRVSFNTGAPIAVASAAMSLPPGHAGSDLLLDLGAAEEGAVFGADWYPREQWNDASFRWSRRSSLILFNGRVRDPSFLSIRAFSRSPEGRPGLAVSVNGEPAGCFVLGGRGWTEGQLRCPSAALRADCNALAFEGPRVSRQPQDPGGFTVPHSDAFFDGSLIVASKDCSDGLVSEIIVNGKQVSPNRFGINLAVIDPAHPVSLRTASLPFGAPGAQQLELAASLKAIPPDALVAVSSRTFGLNENDVPWMKRSLRLLIDSDFTRWFQNAGIGYFRLLEKRQDGSPRWVGDYPVSTSPDLSDLSSVLDNLGLEKVYVATLGEGECPLTPELVEAFESVGIDIATPHQCRVPFAAIGGKFLTDRWGPQAVVGKGTAKLMFGCFPDQRELSFALDRVRLYSFRSDTPE